MDSPAAQQEGMLFLVLLLFLSEILLVYSFNRLPLFKVMFHQLENMKLRDTVWPEYMVEFRDLAPSFRWNELQDAAQRDGVDIFAQDLVHQGMMDMRLKLPISVCVKFPDDETAKRVAASCATVRRVISVWGDGVTPDLLFQNLACRQDMLRGDVHSGKSWRVQFDRYGREGKSGLNPQQKIEKLAHISSALGNIHGKVDIRHPEVDMVYLEDCSTFQMQLKAFVAQRKQDRDSQLQQQESRPGHNVSLTSTDTKSQPASMIGAEMAYTPVRYLFGRVVAEGPPVVGTFALNLRPFVGTTAMNALCAHLSANAAQVKPGQRVLDPFCGTGSLLVAAAYLGEPATLCACQVRDWR